MKVKVKMQQQWRDRGYAVAALEQRQGVVAALRDQLGVYFENRPPTNDWGNNLELYFPTAKLPALNRLAVLPQLLASAQRLLQTDRVRLIQCVAWPKYGDNPHDGAASNASQRMHMDYGNNTIAHPPPWDRPNVASAIVYLDDCNVTGGGTAVVPRRGDLDPAYKYPYLNMPGVGPFEFVNDRAAAERYMRRANPVGWRLRQELYDREVQLCPAAGSVLWYRHDVWHRGTPVKRGHVRFVVNMAWAKESAPVCVWNPGFAQKMYSAFMREFLPTLSGPQLESLGFPSKSHPFWTPDTAEAVARRYGVDLHSRL